MLTSHRLAACLATPLIIVGVGCSDDGSTPPKLAQTQLDPTPRLGDGVQVGCVDAADCRPAEVGACATPTCGADGACGVAPAVDNTPCDDSDVCTLEDRCAAGVCTSGPPMACDDGDPCTEDQCDAALGCQHPPLVCPGAGPCTLGSCDTDTGVCSLAFLDDGVACDDGLPCTAGEGKCDSGVCATAGADSCDDEETCTQDTCTAEGCVFTPRPGACDDGDVCTDGDACVEGTCVGAELACDDEDVCTADACLDGVCTFTPITGCDHPVVTCAGLGSGEPCSDGDPTTHADLCVDGVCAGFVATTIAPAGGPIQDGAWRLTGVDYAQDTWLVSVAMDGTADSARGALGELTIFHEGATLALIDATRGTHTFTGLHEGFAVTRSGTLWESGDSGWTSSGAFPNALAANGARTAHSLFVHLEAGNTVLWVVGQTASAPSIQRCQEVLFGVFEPECRTQSVSTNEPHVIRAVAGSVVCPEFAPCELTLAVGADLFDSTGANGVPRYYNDVYAAEDAEDATWGDVHFDPGASAQTTEAMVALNDGEGGFVMVGRNGYLRDNVPTGEWSQPSVIIDAQSEHHLYGVATTEDVIAIAAWRHVPGDPNSREIVLLTAAIDAALDTPTSWTRHTLGIATGVNAGVYDVFGEGQTIVVVGTTKSATGRESALVYVRNL